MKTYYFIDKKNIWDEIEWEKIIEIKKYKKEMKLNNSFTKANFISVYEWDLYITKKDKYFDFLNSILVEIIERNDHSIDIERLIWEIKFITEWLKNIKFTWKNINFLNN